MGIADGNGVRYCVVFCVVVGLYFLVLALVIASALVIVVESGAVSP